MFNENDYSYDEKAKDCGKILASWYIESLAPFYDPNAIFEEVCDACFTAKVISKKFKAFGINIVIPDFLYVMLDIAVDSNPGYVQMLLKDLLNHIKSTEGPIPDGYVIQPGDYALCFKDQHPILADKKIFEKYDKMFEEQRIDKMHNKCDTVKWWMEVMQRKE